MPLALRNIEVRADIYQLIVLAGCPASAAWLRQGLLWVSEDGVVADAAPPAVPLAIDVDKLESGAAIG